MQKSRLLVKNIRVIICNKIRNERSFRRDEVLELVTGYKTLESAGKNDGKRKRLLKSALELFAEKGYSNTSVRSIIDRSGLGTGTFYKYFNSKEEILKALLEEFLSQIISSIKNYYTQEKIFTFASSKQRE